MFQFTTNLKQVFSTNSFIFVLFVQFNIHIEVPSLSNSKIYCSQSLSKFSIFNTSVVNISHPPAPDTWEGGAFLSSPLFIRRNSKSPAVSHITPPFSFLAQPHTQSSLPTLFSFPINIKSQFLRPESAKPIPVVIRSKSWV